MENKELSFPFDSVLDENGQDDRLYYSEDFTRYFANFISNGVYPNPSNGLKIMAKNGLILTAKKGSGFINGYGYVLNEDLEIRLNIANASYTRKDIVVLRLDLINRSINIFVKEGTPSASPSLPSITRNSDIYELKLAEITIRAGVQAITQADIFDTRLNNSVCGIVTSVVESVDTEDLFEQYETYLNQKIEEWENRKNQQEIDFREQLNNQQEEFEIQHNEIEAWYTSVKLDITKLQSFDFDNLAELKGTTKTTKILSNGGVEEKILMTNSSTNVAKRVTERLTNGDVRTVTTVYERNGIDIMKTATILIKVNTDGSVTEVVS
ncbi:MAG: hypothetical protein K2F59_00295 [Eubacteriales bacterium]|nr:hypothetical protein [Eubacteriales bacterium]